MAADATRVGFTRLSYLRHVNIGYNLHLLQ
jgi:hypothetical protein